MDFTSGTYAFVPFKIFDHNTLDKNNENDI